MVLRLSQKRPNLLLSHICGINMDWNSIELSSGVDHAACDQSISTLVHQWDAEPGFANAENQVDGLPVAVYGKITNEVSHISPCFNDEGYGVAVDRHIEVLVAGPAYC